MLPHAPAKALARAGASKVLQSLNPGRHRVRVSLPAQQFARVHRELCLPRALSSCIHCLRTNTPSGAAYGSFLPA